MGRIWDAHAHVAVGQAAPGEMGISYQKMTPVDRTEALLREMDRNGVERAVLQGSYVPGCNAVAQRAVRTYPDRFVAFCAFDRGLTGDEAAAQVEAWLGYSEFVGVGEVGVHNFFIPGRIDSVEEAKRELRKVVEVAAARRVPVLFHTGYSATNPAKVSGPLTWRDPFHLDEIIAAHREIPLILGHAGGIFDPYPEHAVLLAYHHDNVYLELSKSRTDVIERVVREIGSSKLLWGSDWVRETVHAFGPASEREAHTHRWNLELVERANLSEEARERILWRNLADLLPRGR
ncbi:MAG: TatD family hydrolase [Armatimonadota bacterium]|nr:TatD family hydrolase [Armatimonadota bacterium]